MTHLQKEENEPVAANEVLVRREDGQVVIICTENRAVSSPEAQRGPELGGPHTDDLRTVLISPKEGWMRAAAPRLTPTATKVDKGDKSWRRTRCFVAASMGRSLVGQA